jgi:cytochrome d ubiquinol oxidase subunit II
MSTYTGTFWQLLNPFALLAGVVSSAMITFHGANYLAHRTEGRSRCAPSRGPWLQALAMVAGIPAGRPASWLKLAASKVSSPRRSTRTPCPTRWPRRWVQRMRGWINYRQLPHSVGPPWHCWPVWPAGIGRPCAARRTLSAFIASGLSMGHDRHGGRGDVPLHDAVVSDPRSSLTVWDSVSSHLTLGIMFWATMIFMPLIVFYTSWAYKVMRGKVTVAFVESHDKSAY